MHEEATFKEIDLTGARIGGQLGMDGSTFDGLLTMDGTEIGENLFARFTRFSTDQELILYFSRIGSSLDLCGATIGAIDLTGATITGELRLGSAQTQQPTNWGEASRMVLRNTTVGAIQDADVMTDSWPEYLELEGFTYHRLGGFGAMGAADIAKRNREWFIQWLERDRTFSPQPYEQLAIMLSRSGYPAKANAIRYAARKRSRRTALERNDGKPREWLRWIGLTLLQLTIGYGLGARYFRV
ncbi:MAG: hypothetical protein GWN13_12805, partial [Phycisphaerae bacterium]|nr:hypothetical protein [Phycisphaerae bacterium]